MLLAVISWGQEKISLNKIDYGNSQYIFTESTLIAECDLEGNKNGNNERAPINAIFVISGNKDDNYIIKFLKWKENKNNISNNLKYYYKQINQNRNAHNEKVVQEFNLLTGKANDKISNIRNNDNESAETIEIIETYFLLSKIDLLTAASTYTPIPKYEFVFGTIGYLVRIRPATSGFSSNWSTDLNLGIAYGAKVNFNKNWGISALGGLSLSKIKIDSLSTSPSINKSIEKVTLSPTVNVLLNYKNFFVGLGVGYDWLNLDTEESKRWIYNRKPFYALGIGINLFSSNNGKEPTPTNGNN